MSSTDVGQISTIFVAIPTGLGPSLADFRSRREDVRGPCGNDYTAQASSSDLSSVGTCDKDDDDDDNYHDKDDA